jgi:hypothetical protein
MELVLCNSSQVRLLSSSLLACLTFLANPINEFEKAEQNCVYHRPAKLIKGIAAKIILFDLTLSSTGIQMGGLEDTLLIGSRPQLFCMISSPRIESVE